MKVVKLPFNPRAPLSPDFLMVPISPGLSGGSAATSATRESGAQLGVLNIMLMWQFPGLCEGKGDNGLEIMGNRTIGHLHQNANHRSVFRPSI